MWPGPSSGGLALLLAISVAAVYFMFGAFPFLSSLPFFFSSAFFCLLFSFSPFLLYPFILFSFFLSLSTLFFSLLFFSDPISKRH
jgi:hypothetical protein